MKSILKIHIILLLFIIAGHACFSQDLLKTQNLSQLRVDDLSDADIIQFQRQLQAYGISQQQAEQTALLKGLPPQELQKLRQRLLSLNLSSSQNKNRITRRDTVPKKDSMKAQDSLQKPLINPRIFGSELFTQAALSFQPNLKIPTPINYEIGTDDQLEITIYGVQEANFSLDVSPEGAINIPNVGQIKVAGLTIEAATERIKNAMERTAYSSLRSGASKLSVTLGNIKSIQITIIGANRPGNYTVSSFTTVFNALFLAGGPAENGSFRKIELIRNNRLYRTIDLYQFLVNGSQAYNVSLKNNDVIRIPAYETRVELNGYVKRPGIFEMLPGETLAHLIQYASGFKDSAYKAFIHVTQLTDKAFRVRDIPANQFSIYKPLAGDKFYVGKIIERFENRILISGAVFRPGEYELFPDMSLKDAIQKAEGLREDAFTGRGQIIRLRSDLTKEIIPFNVLNVVNGKENILLKREDSIIIKSIFELRDEYYVSIQGEIRYPGAYNYKDSLSLKDIIILAGGFTDAAYEKRIEIARLISRDTLTQQDTRASDIIEIQGMEDLSSPDKNLLLRPFDVVTIRQKPAYTKPLSVKVSGEVQHPGLYVLSKREEHVSDLLKRAGGFTPEAYIEGAYLKRYNKNPEKKQIQQMKIEALQSSSNDSSNLIKYDLNEFDQIPLDLKTILSQPASPQNIVLQESDELYVPKFNAQVRISGGVLFPTQIPYIENYSVKDYFSAAGGTADNAKKGKTYVLYANGQAKSTKNFLFFRSYPTVKPGSEIIVPQKEIQKNRLTTAEILGISSAIASLAGVVVAIINLNN